MKAFIRYGALPLLLMIATAQTGAEPPQPIDLPTALRLAGAQNLDLQLAQAKLAEARAAQTSAREQFFPWIAPGLGYRRHTGNTQAVTGEILDVDKQAYTAGAALTAQVDLGDATYKTLAARQLVQAADHALAAQRQDSVFAAVRDYFDLVAAQTDVGIAREAVRISQDYEAQVQQAVAAGLTFKGEELRVRVQTERNRLALRQAQERQRLAAARLAQTLRLDVTVDLLARESDLAPLTLVKTDLPLKTLVAQALAARPELRQGQAELAAARATQNGARYGALVPTLGAQVFAGGLGGGVDSQWGNWGDSEEYAVGLSWRIGPGGLFDVGRLRTTAAQTRSAQLREEKLRDEITRQVVDAQTQAVSRSDQLATAQQALAAAEEALRLTQQRKEFAVGNVLENIQAEQELTRARHDYSRAITEHNKAQYALNCALGVLAEQP